jgi:hypothetical protein
MALARTCVVCGTARPVHCTEEQYQAWENGALIQQAMPDVPPAEREMLLSGICAECWKTTFTDEEED